jgi:hypothetical protein
MSAPIAGVLRALRRGRDEAQLTQLVAVRLHGLTGLGGNLSQPGASLVGIAAFSPPPW